jgi:hypothetical protein
VNERDGLQDEMRRLLLREPGSDPLALDQDTADRLLAGRLDPADAPPGYAEVARVLAAAAAPANPQELDSEATAMAVFVTARLERHGAVSHAAPRRSRRWSKLAVATAAVGVLMVGGVAGATTGALPGPAERLADSVSRTAHHLPPWSSWQQGDEGGARGSGQDQRPVGSVGQDGGQRSQGRPAVVAASTGRGATGKVGQGGHAASPAKRGGAHGVNRSAASHAATSACGAGKADSCQQVTPQGRQSGAASESDLRRPADGTGGARRAEGHRKEKGE